MDAVAGVRLGEKINGVIVAGIGGNVYIIDALGSDIFRHTPENAALPGAPVHAAADLLQRAAGAVRQAGIIGMGIVPIAQLFRLLFRRKRDRRGEGVGSDGAEIIDAAVTAVILGGDPDVALRCRDGIVGKIEHVVGRGTLQLEFPDGGHGHGRNPLGNKAQGFAMGVFHRRRPGAAVVFAVASPAEVEASVRIRRDPEGLVVQGRGVEVRGQVKVVSALVPAAGGALLHRFQAWNGVKGVAEGFLELAFVAHPVGQGVAELVKTLGEADVPLGGLVIVGVVEKEQRAQNQQAGEQTEKQRLPRAVLETEYVSAQLKSGQREKKTQNRQNLRRPVDGNAERKKRNGCQHHQRHPEAAGAEGG